MKQWEHSSRIQSILPGSCISSQLGPAVCWEHQNLSKFTERTKQANWSTGSLQNVPCLPMLKQIQQTPNWFLYQHQVLESLIHTKTWIIYLGIGLEIPMTGFMLPYHRKVRQAGASIKMYITSLPSCKKHWKMNGSILKTKGLRKWSLYIKCLASNQQNTGRAHTQSHQARELSGPWVALSPLPGRSVSSPFRDNAVSDAFPSVSSVLSKIQPRSCCPAQACDPLRLMWEFNAQFLLPHWKTEGKKKDELGTLCI